MSTSLPTAQHTGTRPAGKEAERGGRGTAPKGGLEGRRTVVKVVLFLICLFWIVPAFGLLVTSFRPPDAVRTSGWWTLFVRPAEFADMTLANYQAVLEAGMGNSFVNSLVVAVPATVIPILAAAFAAYAFAWMRFPGRETLFFCIVGLIVVPLQASLVPLLQIYSRVGLTGQFAALWLAHTGFGMPLAIYLLRNYMGSLPREILESAKVDGASHFQVFWKLMIPLSVPALAAFAIFQFLWVWNDLLVALIFLGSGDNQVVTIALSELIGSRGQDWHLLTAGAFISMIIPLIVFFSLQRYFIRGLTAGSVKG
jgi:alpha-glucoside transport system permease protein